MAAPAERTVRDMNGIWVLVSSSWNIVLQFQRGRGYIIFKLSHDVGERGARNTE